MRGHVKGMRHVRSDAAVAVAHFERTSGEQREIERVYLIMVGAGMVRDLSRHCLQPGRGLELNPVRFILRQEPGRREMVQRAERHGVQVLWILLGQCGPGIIQTLESGGMRDFDGSIK